MWCSSACENGGVNAQSLRRSLSGIVGSDFSDPTNERLIYLSAAGLVLVGLALLVGTLIWWRRGRQEHPALSTLEVMGQRAWVRATESDRRRRLEHVRLAGAEAAINEPARAEPVDLEALVRSVPQAFDDLREPGEEVEKQEVAEPAGGVVEEVDDAESSNVAEPAESDAAVEDAHRDSTSTSDERPLVDQVFVAQKSATAKDGVEVIDSTSAPIDPL